MNLEPQNQNVTGDREDLDAAEFEEIESLIELLIEDDAEPNNVETSDVTIDLAEAEIAKLSRNSKPEFNSNEQSLAEEKTVESDSKLNSQPNLQTNLTSDRLPNSQLNIATVEEVEKIDLEEASTEDLADTVNSLIPLIVELLEFKIDSSRQGIIQAVRPMLDRLIEERTQEDSPKMAAAIARILPAAIEDEIKQNPLAIARAIAPEIALSIKEQILLDDSAIPETLGPEMGKAIKAQIESEKDAMVDALYPVIGSTISKYMVEVVRDINSKVESTLSLEGFERKFKAKMQGVSEAELIFKESVGYRVRAIFLIDKDSGLVIQEIQIPGEQKLDSDMLAGMLTAIRDFANDCIATDSELDLIDYGDWQIPLEVAGYCYLAAIVAGEPPKKFINKVRRVLGEIVLEHDEAIENFDGNLADVPIGIREKLEQLTETNHDIKSKPSKSSSPILLWLLIFLLCLIFIPWGMASYHTRVGDRIMQATAIQLDAAPELSVYRLDPSVKDGKLIVSGRVPSEYLRDRAGQVVEEIAARNKLEVDNQIIAVDVPVDPDLVRGEISRLTKLLNQQPDIKIETAYRSPSLTVRGFVLDESMLALIEDAFARIPGVERVILNLNRQLPIVKQQIYFDFGSTALDFADNFSKINAVQELLQQYPQLHLKLVVYSDNIDRTQIDRQLGIKRCQSVKTALVARGIESNRLTTDCNSSLSIKNNDNDRAAWLKRYVSFKPFISSNF